MKRQQGFTLIELMVAIAIVAILSAAGLPAYQGYLRKAALTDMLNTFSHLRHAVELCVLTRGNLSHCNGDTEGISAVTRTRFVQRVEVNGGQIHLVGQDILQNLVVKMTPRLTQPDATLVWYRECLGPEGSGLKSACENLFRFDTPSTERD